MKDYGFFVEWLNLEFFATPPTKRSLFYAPVPIFWNEIESLRLLRVPSLPCFAYYSIVPFGEDDRNTQRVYRKVAMKLVIWALGAFLQTIHHKSMT